MATTQAEKILARFKGLRRHLEEGEDPLFTIPAIWDGGQGSGSQACDILLTNRRVFGYIYTTFPRERLFLDALALPALQQISLRPKAFDPVFQELLLSDGLRKVYIRAPRRKIEDLAAQLRSAVARYAPNAPAATSSEQENNTPAAPVNAPQKQPGAFERSPLGVTLLFTGGLVLEILGALLWAGTRSLQTGLPLLIAGLVAVLTATLVWRQRRV